jgi:hypothetical protein
MSEDRICADIRFDLIDRFELNGVLSDFVLNLLVDLALGNQLSLSFLSSNFLLNQ